MSPSGRLPTPDFYDDDDRLPATRQEAIDHILQIRRWQEDSGFLTSRAFQGMLKTLSENLTTTTSRFIYELLQNADDLDYGGASPQVHFTYDVEKRHLLVESNEIGFKKKNVRAICSAAESSKNTQRGCGIERRLIGEKGLGFKSVFKVASSVWIRSGHYSFRFDRDGELGRIRPIWDDDFPAEEYAAGLTTAILLKIASPTHDRQTGTSDPMDLVLQGLENLKPGHLLFLSKAKEVKVGKVVGSGALRSFIRGSTATAKPTAVFKADHIPPHRNTLLPVSLYHNDVINQQVAFRHLVTDLPDTPERPRCLESEVTLVFPLKIPLDEPPESQMVYAFLPIRDYGFKLSIHGDFLLVPSRESIIDNVWNRALVEGVCRALVNAIPGFHRFGYHELFYRWPLLLPPGPTRSDIFEPVQNRLRDLCSLNPVLEDSQGRLVCASQLKIVPTRLKDQDGRNILPAAYSTQHLISDKYPARIHAKLQALGVPLLSPEDFLADLGGFISNFPTEFRGMPVSWHNALCKALHSLLDTHREIIETLEIIPVHDKTWVSFKGRRLYLPSDVDLKLPVSISPLGIDLDIRQNADRAKFFQALGARIADKMSFCDLLLQEHQPDVPNQRFLALTLQDRIEDFVFLYRANWKPKNNDIPELWCAANVDPSKIWRLSWVYLPDKDPYSASSLAKETRLTLLFLHDLYLKTFSQLPGGLLWLSDTLKARRFLRVVQPGPLDWGVNTHRLHSDFKALLQRDPIKGLELLQHHWEFYRSWFVPTTQNGYEWTFSEEDIKSIHTFSSTQSELTNDLSMLEFPCHGGSMARLMDTALPRQSLLVLADQRLSYHCSEDHSLFCWICDIIKSMLARPGPRPVRSDRLLRVNEPEDKSWDFLRHFGVHVEPEPKVFLDYLVQLSGRATTQRDMEQLYEQLESSILKYGHKERDMKDIRSALNGKNYIYIPRRGGQTVGWWAPASLCVWDGPPCLRYIQRIKTFYPHRDNLFRNLLEISNANLNNLLLEVSHLDVSDTEHIKALLVQISQQLQVSAHDLDRPDFSSCAMFPVRLTGKKSMTVVLRSAEEEWCIPEERLHIEALSGVAPLSILDAGFFEMDGMEALVMELGLKERLVSRRLAGQETDKGDAVQHVAFEEVLRGKALYLAELIPNTISGLSFRRKKTQLVNVQVYSCTRINIKLKVKVNGKEVKGVPIKSRVAKEVVDDSLRFYIIDTRKSIPVHWLSELLVEFCGIKNNQDIQLLMQILNSNDDEIIRDELEYRRERMAVVRRPAEALGDTDGHVSANIMLTELEEEESSESESEVEAVPEPEPQPEPQPEVQPEVQLEPQSESEPEPEPENEADQSSLHPQRVSIVLRHSRSVDTGFEEVKRAKEPWKFLQVQEHETARPATTSKRSEHEDFIAMCYGHSHLDSPEVFTQFALDLLYRAGYRKSSPFCTWMPSEIHDRDPQATKRNSITTWSAVNQGFHAGSPLGLSATFKGPESTTTPPVLTLKGVYIDTVHACFDLDLRPDSRTLDLASILHRLRKFLAPLHPDPNPDNEDSKDQWRRDLYLLELLTGDSEIPAATRNPTPLSRFIDTHQQANNPTPPQTPSDPSHRWFTPFAQQILALHPDDDRRILEPEVQANLDKVKATALAFLSRFPDPAVCITVSPENNTFFAGIVPGAAKPGDRVFVPHGSKVPFVVRRKSSGRPRQVSSVSQGSSVPQVPRESPSAKPPAFAKIVRRASMRTSFGLKWKSKALGGGLGRKKSKGGDLDQGTMTEFSPTGGLDSGVGSMEDVVAGGL
ncbi:hypothetical protein QC761_508110 [Podospora bellae-mahoneyi]|uniref:Uncharacterized protein n=1 Tax=Podospora bellae-mahoneyi TaxID=2093777 RepID=A0ABR0FH83_9PEZI|nr:hypothetical protein QC761_508110 [Podospora bellae-mahoneyi]